MGRKPKLLKWKYKHACDTICAILQEHSLEYIKLRYNQFKWSNRHDKSGCEEHKIFRQLYHKYMRNKKIIDDYHVNNNGCVCGVNNNGGGNDVSEDNNDYGKDNGSCKNNSTEWKYKRACNTINTMLQIHSLEYIKLRYNQYTWSNRHDKSGCEEHKMFKVLYQKYMRNKKIIDAYHANNYG